MEISLDESNFYHGTYTNKYGEELKPLLCFKMESIDLESKYLGFMLKPNSYWSKDWGWMVKRIDRRQTIVRINMYL